MNASLETVILTLIMERRSEMYKTHEDTYLKDMVILGKAYDSKGDNHPATAASLNNIDAVYDYEHALVV